MDGYAQGNRLSSFITTNQPNLVYIESTSTTAKAAIDLIDNIGDWDANERFTRLKSLLKLLEESAQRNSEKATLAKVTSDAVRPTTHI